MTLENDAAETQASDVLFDEEATQAADDASESTEEITNKEGEENTEDASENNEAEIYGSPETYDYSNVELPEGMTLDKDLVEKFNPLAKKYNLSNKSANELMNLAVELVGKNTPDATKLVNEIKTAEANEYQKMLNTDKELNAMNEEQYGEYINLARLGVKSVATDEFKALLKDKGLSNHPAFIKTFYKIGKLCKTDTVPTGSTPVTNTESAADILYGSKN